MTTDEQIGRNVATARGELSQKDLAARMRELGWKWSQATVWSVEKGERPLRLAEAEDLATVLGVSSYVFTRSEPIARLEQRMRRVSELNREFEELIEAYRMAQWELALTADEVRDQFGEAMAEAVEGWLVMTPERVISDIAAKDEIMAKANRELEKVGGILDDEILERLDAQAEANRGHFEELLVRYMEAGVETEFGIDRIEPKHAVRENWSVRYDVTEQVIDLVFASIVGSDG